MLFITSDLHLNHRNIIRYCSRPFRDLEEMNHRLVKNWNMAVREQDTVIFLGDLAFGNIDFWLKKLNGKKLFIKGNHDHDKIKEAQVIEDSFLKYNGTYFLLTHRPERPWWWDGWVIHGHSHNTRPLIDRENKMINVSCEMTRYRPISLVDITDLFESKTNI